MKHFILFLALNCFTGILSAQPDAAKLHETAKAFMRQGDYANAILVLNRAVQQQPGDIGLLKDLSFSHYFQKDYQRALEIVKPLLDRDDVDDQTFQIAGNIYKALGMLKECEKMYKKGIRKFPGSGALYNEYGELLIAQRNPQAIEIWEKGIEADPSYSRNYYHAALYHDQTGDLSWSLLYGEMFVNMEPLGRNTPEIKEMLFASYKKLFANSNVESSAKSQSGFTRAFLQTMNKQSTVASYGINTETLTMIRTRFILDWNTGHASKYPFKLFEYHRQLLREGLFDAYNQWLFGSSESLTRFQAWTVNHKDEYAAFLSFQKGRIFKVPERQSYR